MNLSGSFSYEQRLQFVRGRLKAGVVIKLHCDFTNPPKQKRLLVVAVNRGRPLLFVINSDPTDFAKNHKHLIKQHLPLKASDENFLDHDSYLDCSTAYDNFDRDDIERALAQDTTLILGDLAGQTAPTVLETVADSPTLSPVHINAISDELSKLF